MVEMNLAYFFSSKPVISILFIEGGAFFMIDWGNFEFCCCFDFPSGLALILLRETMLNPFATASPVWKLLWEPLSWAHFSSRGYRNSNTIFCTKNTSNKKRFKRWMKDKIIEKLKMCFNFRFECFSRIKREKKIVLCST